MFWFLFLRLLTSFRHVGNIFLVVVILWHLFNLVIFDFNSVNFYVKLDKLDFLENVDWLIVYLSRWTDTQFTIKFNCKLWLKLNWGKVASREQQQYTRLLSVCPRLWSLDCIAEILLTNKITTERWKLYTLIFMLRVSLLLLFVINFNSKIRRDFFTVYLPNIPMKVNQSVTNRVFNQFFFRVIKIE